MKLIGLASVTEFTIPHFYFSRLGFPLHLKEIDSILEHGDTFSFPDRVEFCFCLSTYYQINLLSFRLVEAVNYLFF